eukprot:5142374-Amphidinium_carterae.1
MASSKRGLKPVLPSTRNKCVILKTYRVVFFVCVDGVCCQEEVQSIKEHLRIKAVTQSLWMGIDSPG